MDELRRQLSVFDGVRTDTLEEIASTLDPEAAVLDSLCELALSEDLKLQSASTWLLKRYVEDGHKLNDEQSSGLLEVLVREGHWEAKLHILQMLDALTITATNAPILWSVLRGQTSAGNKLICAWSYHGLVVIADKHSAYRRPAKEWLERGEHHEAASVRTRIRRLRLAYAWLRC